MFFISTCSEWLRDGGLKTPAPQTSPALSSSDHKQKERLPICSRVYQTSDLWRNVALSWGTMSPDQGREFVSIYAQTKEPAYRDKVSRRNEKKEFK